MNTWKDEKELVILSLIASTLFIFTVNQFLGIINSLFVIIYFLVIGSPYAIQFRVKKGWITSDSVVTVLIGLTAFIFISGILLGINLSQNTLYSVLKMMSTDIASNVALPLKIFIWGIFIPLAETLFIFGVIFGFIRKKFNLKYGINIENIAAIIILAVLLEFYHTQTQDINSTTFIVDTIFVAISGVIVLKKNELKDSFFFHSIINVLKILVVAGVLLI